MLRFLLVLLCFSCVFTSQAQVKIDWGETIDSENKMRKIIGEDQDGNVYALMYKSKKYYISKFVGADMSESFSKQIVLPEIDGKDLVFDQIYLMHNKLIILGSNFNNKLSKFRVMAYECSLSGIMDKKGKLLLDIEADTRDKAGALGYLKSGDGTKFLLHTVSYDKNKNNFINIKVFDADFKQVNGYEETIKAVQGGGMVKITVGNFVLNNSGSMFYSHAKMYYKSKGIDFGDDYNNDRDYSIIEIDLNGKKREIPVKLKNLKAAQMAFMVGSDDNLMVSGLYYQKQSKGVFKGVYLRGSFYVKIDSKTGQTMAETSKPFDNAMMMEYRSAKQLDKGVYLDNYFHMKGMYEKPDGGLVVIAEYYRRSESQSGMWTTYTHHYGDLIVINIDKGGDVEWTKAIYKSQIYYEKQLAIMALGPVTFNLVVTNDQAVYYSYLADVSTGDIKILYNDNASNVSTELPRKKTKSITNPKKAIPMLATFDDRGKLEKEMLKNVVNGDVYLRPQIHSRISDEAGSYIIYGSKGKDDKLGRMKL